MAGRTFTDVKLVAEHVPETHRTLENDRTITTVELPGTVEVYLVIDGGRIPFTHLRGGDVLEAIDRAGAEQKAAEQSQQQQAAAQQQTQTTTPTQPPAEPQQQAAAQQQTQTTTPTQPPAEPQQQAAAQPAPEQPQG